MKTEAQEELANQVIRLVRSGDWKKLRTHKDKSIHNYLTRNLTNRENMLARYKILQELGDEAPEEVKTSTKQAQYENRRVIEKQSGRVGWLAYYDDQGQAWVLFDDEDREVTGPDEGLREPTPVDIKSLQFTHETNPIEWKYQVGQYVVLDGTNEQYMVMNLGQSSSLTDARIPAATYEIQKTDDPSNRIWVMSSQISPVKPSSIGIDLRGGDQVVDIRYNILGTITEMSDVGHGRTGTIKVDYGKHISPEGVGYPPTALNTIIQKYDPSKHNPSDVPETPLRSGQIITWFEHEKTTKDPRLDAQEIGKVLLRNTGEPYYETRNIETGSKGSFGERGDYRGTPTVLNPDPGQIFKRRSEHFQTKPTGVGDVFVRFLYFEDYSNTTASVQTPFGKIRKVNLQEFEPVASNELARLNQMFDRVKMPQEVDGLAQTQLKPGQTVHIQPLDNVGVIESINYNGTATVTRQTLEKMHVNRPSGRKERNVRETVVIPLDQLTPLDIPVERSGSIAYDMRTQQFVDVLELGTFGLMKVRPRSPDPYSDVKEFNESRDNLKESSEEAYADAAAKVRFQVGDKVRVVSTPADVNGIGVVSKTDSFTPDGTPVYEIQFYNISWGNLGGPHRDKPGTPVVDDDLTQITKLDTSFNPGDEIFSMIDGKKMTVVAPVEKTDTDDNDMYQVRPSHWTDEQFNLLTDNDKKHLLLDGALMQRPITDLEAELGDLSQYENKFVDADGTWALDHPQKDSPPPPMWFKELMKSGPSRDGSTRYLIINNISFDEEKNGISIRFNELGSSNMWNTTVDKDTFTYMTKFMHDPSDITETTDPLNYDQEKPSLVKDQRGRYVDYKPVGEDDGDPVFSITPLFKINDSQFRDSGEYEKNAQSNPKVVAAAIDELLFLTANKVLDDYRFTSLAKQNGYITDRELEEHNKQFALARANLFKGLTEQTILKLYDLSQYKAQFATALAVSAEHDNATEPHSYAASAEVDAKYAAVGKVLGDQRTYEALFSPANKIIFTTGPANEVTFAPNFRGRASEGTYVRTTPMMMMSSFLSLGSRLDDGKGIEALASAMPFDGPNPTKLKRLFNYMLGYQATTDGNVLRHQETGQPLLELDENGNCPAAAQSDDKAGQWTNKLLDAARVVNTSYDSNGRPMQTFIDEVAAKHPKVNVKYLTRAIEAFRDNDSLSHEDKSLFTPHVMQAIDDRSISENGESLLDMLSPSMDRRNEPWKTFTPPKGSMKPTDAAEAVLSKQITLDQAEYLSNSKSIANTLMTTIYNSHVAKEGVTLTNFVQNMDQYVQQFGLQEVVTGSVQKALISSDEFFGQVNSEQLYELIKSGAYAGIDLEKQMGRLGNYPSLAKAVEILKVEYIEQLTNLEDLGAGESEAIKNHSISSYISREAFSNVTPESLRSVIFKPGRTPEQTTKLLAKMSTLFFGDPQNPEVKYGSEEQAAALYDPIHQVFDTNGKLWPRQFSYLSNEESEEAYDAIKPIVTGIQDADYTARRKANEASKAINAVSKEMHVGIYKSLDPAKAERFEKMYKLLTGDLGGQGGSTDDASLAAAYSTMSNVGYLSKDQLAEIARIFDDPKIVDSVPTTDAVVRRLVDDFVFDLESEEVDGVLASLRPDKIEEIKNRIYDQLEEGQLSKMYDNISTIEKDPLTNKPARDEKGEIKRKLDLPSLDRKRLDKSLGINKNDSLKDKLSVFLDKLKIEGAESDKERFKQQMQMLQDSPVLLDSMLKQVMKLDKEKSQVRKLLDDFDIIAEVAEYPEGKKQKTKQKAIGHVLAGIFATGIVPPATGAAEGIAGSIPHETRARYFYVPSLGNYGRGNRLGDHLGPEFNVSHLVKPQKIVFPEYELDPELSKEERDKSIADQKEQEQIFKEAMNYLAGEHGHDSNVAWLRAEVFKVKGDQGEEKILGAREIQIDGLQNYSKKVTRAAPNHLKEGDEVWAYPPELVRERQSKIDELNKTLKATTDPDRRNDIRDEIRAVMFKAPELARREVKKDKETGKPYYMYVPTNLPEGTERKEIRQDLERVLPDRLAATKYERDTFAENMYHHRKMDKREQAVYDEIKKGYHLIYRSLLRSAVAAGCDKVYVLPSWVAMNKPDVKDMDTRTPRADWRQEVMGTYAQQTHNTVKEKVINPETGKMDTKETKLPAYDAFGNEIWQARGISQPGIDAYDNTAREWGFTLQDLDHFWQTDPYWGYGASMLVSKAWVFDLKNSLSRQMAGRRMARKQPVRMIIAQINQAGEALAAYLTTYFAIQMRDERYQFDKSKAVLQEAFFQWLYDPSNRDLTQQQIAGAIVYAGAKIGVDMSEINDPAWKFGAIPQEAYDNLITSGPSQAGESEDRPPVVELAQKLDKIMLDIMPNLMAHQEYRHLSAEEIPIQVAKDLLNEPLVFPWSAVREDMDYRFAVLRAVSAFDVSPEKEEELAALQREDEDFDPLQQAISEEPTAIIEEAEVSDQIANQIAGYLRQEGDSYSNFVIWIDAESPELHANDDLRSEVLEKLRQMGYLNDETADDHDVPSVDDLEELFRESRRLITGRLAEGDRVEVYSPVSRDVRAKALAAKRATGKVCASTNSGYVVKFDDAYDERVLNSQRWLFNDVHLLKQGRQA